jgi:hypothetical protein
VATPGAEHRGAYVAGTFLTLEIAMGIERMHHNSITGIHGQYWREISGEHVGDGFRSRV